MAILYSLVILHTPSLARVCNPCLAIFSDLQSDWLEKPILYTSAILLYFDNAVPDILVRNHFCCGFPSPRKPYFPSHRFLHLS
ncbi:hypothetical protein [Pontibacter mucosus]|uniref:hypothetical protein n=1 Tax=Pontibacter mucosus TaxID=1649266 RepID=UPI0011B2046E|nr:hypothetical protein [Pontibacter mucosus]